MVELVGLVAGGVPCFGEAFGGVVGAGDDGVVVVAVADGYVGEFAVECAAVFGVVAVAEVVGGVFFEGHGDLRGGKYDLRREGWG